MKIKCISYTQERLNVFNEYIYTYIYIYAKTLISCPRLCTFISYWFGVFKVVHYIPTCFILNMLVCTYVFTTQTLSSFGVVRRAFIVKHVYLSFGTTWATLTIIHLTNVLSVHHDKYFCRIIWKLWNIMIWNFVTEMYSHQ